MGGRHHSPNLLVDPHHRAGHPAAGPQRRALLGVRSLAQLLGDDAQVNLGVPGGRGRPRSGADLWSGADPRKQAARVAIIALL